jgi:intraflagellar transport protein 81
MFLLGKVASKDSFSKMNYQIDLKAISNAISAKPFNIQWSIIQLHDEITPTQLLQTLFDVSGFVDEANVSSIFPIDRPLEEKVFRLVEFLQMLKYKPAANVELCMKDIMQFNRDAILAAMTFLVSDITSHKKRAYLALYLSTPDIPVDFSQDDGI